MTRATCLGWAAYYDWLALWARACGAPLHAREMTAEADRWRAAAERTEKAR